MRKLELISPQLKLISINQELIHHGLTSKIKLKGVSVAFSQ